MELLKSTIYTREYFYTTLNGDEVEYRALTYRELDTIQTKYSNKQNQSRISTVKSALLFKEDFSILSHTDIDTLATNILEVSTLSNNDMETIEFSVEVVLDDTFKDDSFKSCKLCQERKLDKHRNCPMLDVSTHDKGVFYIVGKKKLDICPMEGVNSPLIADAFKAYSMYDKGFLPSSGGMYDQTMFFIETSSLVKGIISNHQAKAMESK